MSDTIDCLDTPAVLIEKAVLDRNIAAMQKLADSRGVQLRVHVKSHKIPELALRQIESGAVGIAVAKIGEAEVMAAAGIEDIQVANIIIGSKKIERLRRLHEKCRLTVAIDSIEGTAGLARVFSGSARPLEVLIKVDCGLRRCGLDSPDAIRTLWEKARKLEGISIVGLMTHGGHAYGAADRDQVRQIGDHEGRLTAGFARQLKSEDFPVKTVSVGSTPTAEYCSAVEGVTELRVGNYIFNDMTQVSLGTVPPERCALTVLATVISRPSPDRAVIDAGSKALALDRGAHGSDRISGFGWIGEGCEVSRLSEEHGIIEPGGGRLNIGERVKIIPNHACTVVNLFNDAWLIDGSRVVEKFRVAARGMMT